MFHWGRISRDQLAKESWLVVGRKVGQQVEENCILTYLTYLRKDGLSQYSTRGRLLMMGLKGQREKFIISGYSLKTRSVILRLRQPILFLNGFLNAE